MLCAKMDQWELYAIRLHAAALAHPYSSLDDPSSMFGILAAELAHAANDPTPAAIARAHYHITLLPWLQSGTLNAFSERVPAVATALEALIYGSHNADTYATLVEAVVDNADMLPYVASHDHVFAPGCFDARRARAMPSLGSPPTGDLADAQRSHARPPSPDDNEGEDDPELIEAACAAAREAPRTAFQQRGGRTVAWSTAWPILRDRRVRPAGCTSSRTTLAALRALRTPDVRIVDRDNVTYLWVRTARAGSAHR